MKKLSNKLFVALGTVASALGLGTQFAHAAADADLTSALASTSAIATDNKATIIGYFVTLGVAILVIVVAKRAIITAVKWVSSAVGGKKKK